MSSEAPIETGRAEARSGDVIIVPPAAARLQRSERCACEVLRAEPGPAKIAYWDGRADLSNDVSARYRRGVDSAGGDELRPPPCGELLDIRQWPCGAGIALQQGLERCRRVEHELVPPR